MLLFPRLLCQVRAVLRAFADPLRHEVLSLPAFLDIAITEPLKSSLPKKVFEPSAGFGSGDIAQLGERCVRIAEVGGSNPPISIWAPVAQRIEQRFPKPRVVRSTRTRGI